MRIIYLHQYFNTPAMSGITRSYELGRRLVRMGHEVHVITTQRDEGHDDRGWRRTHAAGMHVHWCPVPYSNHMAFRERIGAFAKFALLAGPKAASLRGDVLYVTSPPLTIALPAVYAAQRNHIPMIFEVRDLWPTLPIAFGALRNPVSRGAARWLERLAYRRSTRVVALSPGTKEGIVAAGYPAQRVAVIPNGCDFAMFDVDAEWGQRFRRRFAWLGDRRLVVYTGTLGIANGVDYLARLAEAVKRRDPEIRFLIVGSGREEGRVRQEAARLGVLDHTFFMLPNLAKAEMPSVLSAADLTTSVVVHIPEMWANSANKFFDSLAAGRPIAINHGGWQAEMLAETGAGLTLDVHDVEDAADQLVRAVDNPAWLARAGAAARRLGRERFDRDMLALQLEEVLRAAVASVPDEAAQASRTLFGDAR